MPFSVNKSPIIAAHRGDAFRCPENTMAAFLSAVKHGAEMIESDIHLSKDGVPVLIHDRFLDKTTDGSGVVEDLTYEELQKVNAGKNTNGFYPIPTLEELLGLAEKTPSLLLNLEIKVFSHEEGAERSIEAIQKTVDAVRRHGLSKRVMMNSFDAFVLEYIDEHYHGEFQLHGFFPFGMLGNKTRNPEEYLDYAGYYGTKETAEKDFAYLLSKGIRPCMGEPKEEGDFETYFRYGCAIFTVHDVEKAFKSREKL